MKIFIIGPSGSGKTTLANQLSKKTNIEHTNLDDIFWYNKTNSFNIKQEETLRNNLYNEVLNKESWKLKVPIFLGQKKDFF
jgi:adenylate kinase family enzyme